MSEREKVVAWLRAYATDAGHSVVAEGLNDAADAIERGDHMKSPPPGEQPSVIEQGPKLHGWGLNIPEAFRR